MLWSVFLNTTFVVNVLTWCDIRSLEWLNSHRNCLSKFAVFYYYDFNIVEFLITMSNMTNVSCWGESFYLSEEPSWDHSYSNRDLCFSYFNFKCFFLFFNVWVVLSDESLQFYFILKNVFSICHCICISTNLMMLYGEEKSNYFRNPLLGNV